MVHAIIDLLSHIWPYEPWCLFIKTFWTVWFDAFYPNTNFFSLPLAAQLFLISTLRNQIISKSLFIFCRRSDKFFRQNTNSRRWQFADCHSTIHWPGQVHVCTCQRGWLRGRIRLAQGSGSDSDCAASIWHQGKYFHQSFFKMFLSKYFQIFLSKFSHFLSIFSRDSDLTTSIVRLCVGAYVRPSSKPNCQFTFLIDHLSQDLTFSSIDFIRL